MPTFALKAVSAAVLSLVTFAATAADTNCPNCFAKRWVYFQGNLANPEHLAAIKRLVDDAKANGFNGIAINSGGYGSYTQLIVDPTTDYMKALDANLKAAVAYAASQKIELVPVGGGPGVPASKYPELTEALPASATYQVSGGVASIVPTPIPTEGTFDVKGSWEMDTGPDQDNPYVSIDPTEGHMDESTDTRSAVKLVPSAVAYTGTQRGWLNSRLMREFKLSANKAYRLSFWLKSSAGYATDKLFIQLIPTGSDQPIYRNGSSGLGWGTQPNGEWNAKGNSEEGMFDAGQDWKRYDLDFNTGDKSAIRMYLGTQSVGVAGTAVWVDDLQVTELGLAHPIRRSTTPIVVTPATGGTPYVENTDYEIDSTDKTRLRILRNSIAEGAKLKVSWYQSGVNMTGRWSTAATACTSDGRYYSAQKSLYDKLYAYYGDKFPAETTAKYFMYYDEIRLMNWDPACKYTTAGEYLRNVVNGVNTRLTNAKSGYAKPLEVLVWNDMFDLQMNAVSRYWHVKGDLSKWTTPLAKNIVIVNWAGGGGTETTDDDERKASLAQFAGEGHKQVVALYYDNLPSVTNWANVMNAATNVPIDGVMYTTWKSIDDKTPYAVPYGNLAKVAAQMRASFKGRWPE